MDNLFKEGREKNWIWFFENDPVMMAQALALCKTGVVKVNDTMPQLDYSDHWLWKRIKQ